MIDTLPRIPASGNDHRLVHGDDEVHVASVGASLRSYRHRDRDLVVGFEAGELRPAYRGATLAPWPNRVVDGRYRFDGDDHQLALTEPRRGHALHGLAAWLDFAPVDVADDRITLTAVVQPQQGYPWRLVLDVEFRLGDDGLTQTVRATNLSDRTAPYGTGPHPYLVAGAGTVDDWTLLLPADQVLLTDERLAPSDLAHVSVDANRFDFRTARRIQAVEIDHAFTGLVAGADDRVEVRLTDDAGSGVAMTWDAACPWVQVHTADQEEGPANPAHRIGLAVEPMTCGPDAFNRHADFGLVELEPGADATAWWRISPISPP